MFNNVDGLFKNYISEKNRYDRVDMLDEAYVKFFSSLSNEQRRLFNVLKREYSFFREYELKKVIRICCKELKNSKQVFLVAYPYILRKGLYLAD